MFKVILTFIMVNVGAYAVDSDSITLREQIQRMASVAQIPLDSLDDIHFSKPLEERAPYWVMNLLYSSGKLDRILLADAIYKSGLRLDNSLIKEMKFRWDTSLALNISEILILKTRDLVGGYIVGLYGTYQNIQDAARSVSPSVRQAHQHLQDYLNRGSQSQYVSKSEILQKAWAEAYRNAFESLSFNNNEWNIAFFFDPSVDEADPQMSHHLPRVLSPIHSNASAPDLTPTRRRFPSVPPQELQSDGTDEEGEVSPLADLEVFQTLSSRRSYVRPPSPPIRTFFAAQPQPASYPHPAPQEPMSISDAFAANPIHQHDSLAWFSDLGLFCS